jgi:hypothetical protein
MRSDQMMTPDLLSLYGTLLLGDRWQRPLARLLGVDDRLVRRWAAGERPIPDWVHDRLRSTARDRRRELARLS